MPCVHGLEQFTQLVAFFWGADFQHGFGFGEKHHPCVTMIMLLKLPILTHFLNSTKVKNNPSNLGATGFTGRIV